MNMWFVILLVMLASFIVQRMLNSRIEKYSRVPSPRGLTGADIARMMLAQNGINDVTVQSVAGKLTDHYNPQDRTINLSEGVYASASIAACAIAAHETDSYLVCRLLLEKKKKKKKKQYTQEKSQEKNDNKNIKASHK